MKRRIQKAFSVGFTLTWPPSWRSLRFWATPGDVKGEMSENARALAAAHEKLTKREAKI